MATEAPTVRTRSESPLVSLRRNMIFRRSLYGIIFVGPAMVFFAMFSLYPMVNGLYISLTQYSLLKPPVFIGITNYLELFKDAEFLNALKVTAGFVLGTTVPKWVLSLLLALLFTQQFRGREIFKTLYFTPALLSGVVISLVWKLLFDPNGLVSAFMSPILHRPEIFWLADTSLTPLALIAVDNWADIPFYMMIWIAGLNNIPRDFYEAALIDGANRWQAFWRITLPLLRPTALFVMVITTINAFQGFQLQYIMTKGGPTNVTTTLALLVYKYGFKYYRMGMAAAQSVFMFAIIILFTLIQLRGVRSEDTSYT
jgi:multiple sugar transport system permease protein